MSLHSGFGLSLESTRNNCNCDVALDGDVCSAGGSLSPPSVALFSVDADPST